MSGHQVFDIQVEIIIINDGSTDNSGKICDDYAKLDDRIHVIHKKNEGVSAARNEGLKIVKGQYIGFVDSDDWVEPTMFESLKNWSVQYEADVAICGFCREETNGDIIYCSKKTDALVLTAETAISLALQEDSYQGYLVNKLFRSSLFINGGSQFDTNVHVCEDLYFVCQHIAVSHKIVYNSEPFYHYCMRENSACKNDWDEKKLSLITARERIIRLVTDLYPNLQNQVKCLYICSALYLIRLVVRSDKKGKATFKKLQGNLRKYKKEFLACSEMSIRNKTKLVLYLTIPFIGHIMYEKLVFYFKFFKREVRNATN
ncbi:MAG: glycosyltransferase [Hyphomonadaceae bacterium]|nr:glycosyltransferase [Clostridia bacterium]